MALTIFLFKVSHLEIGKNGSESIAGSQEQLASNLPSTKLIADENTPLLSAKITFRGITRWSNNVPVQNGTANFVAFGERPTKFQYNLATMLMPDDQVRIEFHTVTMKRKRKKLVAIFELMLETLIDRKYIDLPEENLSDPNNYLMPATAQFKVYYTPPNIDKQKAALAALDDDAELVDWNETFDDEGRHGGHRYRHGYTKHDSKMKKFRQKFVGRTDNADTDSGSDSDYDGKKRKGDGTMEAMTEVEKLRLQHNNVELLEKSLGRYTGDAYHVIEWQVMVHVIQGKDLPGLDLNPYVCVQIDDMKRFTVIQKSSNSPYYGEFFTFDFKLPASQMMEKVIYCKVHHAHKILSKFTHTKPVAVFKVDVSTVYNEKEHAFERKWAQLTDPKDISVKCGHLLLSMAVTQQGVLSKNVLGEADQDDDEIKPAKEFIPAAMPRRLFPVQLKVILYKAEELPEMMTDFLASVSKKILQSDNWEPVDPYIEVTYNGIQAATGHRNGTSPLWGEALYFVGQFPPLVRTIKIALKDHAAVQRDRIIASFLIDLFLISESNPSAGFLPTLGPSWMFVYGSPREYRISTEQDGLGEGMGEGVCYKGRILMAVECHPVNTQDTGNMSVQKDTGIRIPEEHHFPMKRTFVLFGCIFDVTMIDKAFGNSSICFELSIGSKGYLNVNELAVAQTNPVPSLTRPYPRIPVDNNSQHFRLPIDLQKPIIFTKYEYYDYIFRMSLSNRLKRAAAHLSKDIREYETKINSKASREEVEAEYRKMEQYVHLLPCGCNERQAAQDTHGAMPVVHPTLSELTNTTPSPHLKMNQLDRKRRTKILQSLEALKSWISKDVDFNESKRYETVNELRKIARSLEQLARDIQPALPDVFLWMICDSKRVAYARLPPEDILYSSCDGEKGLYNGKVQTLFLKTPHTSDKPLKSSTNAKIQIYLWLGTDEQQSRIFKQLPPGFDMPTLPLSNDLKFISYQSRFYYELRCHCIKARSLLASDETGLSDPYLSITVANETQTTPVLKQSLCPQWNVTLAFRNLMYVGNRETAEEIIGSVVVECYDYDEAEGPEIIGRFSATAKLDLFNEENNQREKAFKWYEFKSGGNRAGELLAVFELIDVDPVTRLARTEHELEEVEITPNTYPSQHFVTKFMRNKIYYIPDGIMPDMHKYEIEVMFWGLRECRSINLQSIHEAEVTVECAGARVMKLIKDAQKQPNFQTSSTESDKYKMIVNLPKDNNFWPHLSILCVQHRLFGMKEIVGNLVVTDLQKYIEKPLAPLTPEGEALADAVNELSKQMSYDFNRVRRSVVDAYEAALAAKGQNEAKRKLFNFEFDPRRLLKGETSSETAIVEENPGENSEVIQTTEDTVAIDELIDQNPTESTAPNSTPESPVNDEGVQIRQLTTLEKLKRNEMERAAGWWNKYYASKAQVRLAQRLAINMNEGLQDSADVYADFFESEKKVVVKPHMVLWGKAKQAFVRAGKAQQYIRRLAEESIEDNGREKQNGVSAVDQSLDNIEVDRLKELTLLQTFDFIDTELENVHDYEGFNDCLETFPLYKGKGSSRSDEMGDENRVYAKFKGKIRIRELPMPRMDRKSTLMSNLPQKSLNPTLFDIQTNPVLRSNPNGGIRTHEQMLKFDLNKHPLILKCRLYIVKALLFRGWDSSGKADPFLKIALNNQTIIDDTKGKLQNTLEPMFGKSFEFEVNIPSQSILRVQIWDWDMTSSNDMIAETKIDIENRWFSCHRATCGLPKRYDSTGYNAWRDVKKPTIILNELCRTNGLKEPIYTADYRSVAIENHRFDCDPEILEFLSSGRHANDITYRKVHHESPSDYIRQNTALAALHAWGRKVNPKGALVAEHIESRSLFNPELPDVEQGKLEMWLDFFPMSRPPSGAPINITPPKPVKYQLRLTIWNTADVELNDENFLTGEKTSDIYVKAWIRGEKDDCQQTDIHYRSLTGEGNFNWRFVFDFDFLEIEEKIVYEAKDSVFQVGSTLKKIPPRIIIRVYDADFFSADDFLGECILDLTHIPVGAKKSSKCKANIVLDPTHKSMNLFVNRRIAGWWPMLAPNVPGVIRDKAMLGGKVEAEFALVTAEDAEKNPVGKAREAPQPLDEPNRPKTSFLWFTSPWKTLRFVIWRNFKWQIILTVVIVIVIVFLLLAIWTLPGQIVTQLLNKVFKN